MTDKNYKCDISVWYNGHQSSSSSLLLGYLLQYTHNTIQYFIIFLYLLYSVRQNLVCPRLALKHAAKITMKAQSLGLYLQVQVYTIFPGLYGAGDGTKGFVHDRQVLYPLSYMVSPLLSLF